ncbi:MAG: RluA family pseudouridine synthase [Clostridiales bacterium]|nr:RluA family pseudouridine synthase [Clostridiales bacterium]
MEHWNMIVDSDQEGSRLDACLAGYLDGYSRSYLQKLIRNGQILVNQKEVKPNYKCHSLDQIEATIPDPDPLNIIAEPMNLDILYEDSDLIFVNKPKGMVVHPAAGHSTGTLVNGLMAHCGNDLSGINGVLRPGIVHRIDMDTTGVLVVCKNDFTHTQVAAQLADHSITRKYHAIVHGVIQEEEGTVDFPIGRSKNNRLKMARDMINGKRAVTHYRVLKRFQNYTYIECQLETGRTHQIRVHMTQIHHPLLGDTLYGNIPNKYHLQGQTLHAKVLGLVHPRTGEYLECEAPLPEYFRHLLDILN